MLGKAKEAMGGQLAKIAGLPDKFENPTHRRIARIFFNIAVMSLGIVLIKVVGAQGVSMSTAPMIGAGVVAVGCGGAYLLEDVFGRKHSQRIYKIMAIAAPILMVAAIYCVAKSTPGAYVQGMHGQSVFSFDSFMHDEKFMAVCMLSASVPYLMVRAWEAAHAKKQIEAITAV